MDPWLDDRPETVLEFLKDTFMSHYNGRRQPFGLWTHPIHLATGYPGLSDPCVAATHRKGLAMSFSNICPPYAQP